MLAAAADGAVTGSVSGWSVNNSVWRPLVVAKVASQMVVLKHSCTVRATAVQHIWSTLEVLCVCK
jgi:hypothetical protein